jgi:pimeloyl-ACP methyl ester carboxylesterase
MSGDDSDEEDLDGIVATQLIQDVHFIPGLWKIDGYTMLSRLITETFAVECGKLESSRPANFFEFPYDWRRDNRAAARKLKRFIDEALPRWRSHSGAGDAKCILLAHSMGGLVARHYLEVLEGWRDCRALVTFGTPHRGSPKALNMLSNGYKILFDLTEPLRSFTSVYQLLPIYPIVDVEGDWKRVSDVDGLPGLDRKRSEESLRFHRAIEVAVDAHRNEATYLDPLTSYRILPVVGVAQPTLQSAIFKNGGLSVDDALPTGVPDQLRGGDGTVPRLSATPIELTNEFRDTFIAERHAALQSNAGILDDLRQRLIQLQGRQFVPIRGPALDQYGEGRPAISLQLDDLYGPGEPIIIRAWLVAAGDMSLIQEDRRAPAARIQPVEGGKIVRQPFVRDEVGWVLYADELPQGVFRIDVRFSEPLPSGWQPRVQDVFAVMRG